MPTGGSSYLSAVGMPVVEPTVNHIWALLRVLPSEMSFAACVDQGNCRYEPYVGLHQLGSERGAPRKPCRANGRVLKKQRP